MCYFGGLLSELLPSCVQVNDIPEGGGGKPAANVAALQALSPPYGKFNSEAYPFLFWEPSDEPSIAAVVQQVAGGPAVHPVFRFATNSGFVWEFHLTRTQDLAHLPFMHRSCACELILFEYVAELIFLDCSSSTTPK